MIRVLKHGESQMLADMRSQPARIRRAMSYTVGQEAHLLRKIMVRGIRDQAPGGRPILPLADMTIKLRRLRGMRGRKALIARSDLLKSITAQKQGELSWTVGVHRGARTRDGRDLVNLALVHEEGTRWYSVTVTPRMHRFSLFLMSQGILGAPWKVGTRIRRKVPARPFLRPAWNEWIKDSQKRFHDRLVVMMSAERMVG